TISWLPASSAWEALKLWRDRNGTRAAPGVPKLAGRFCFDLWHGKFRETADSLRRAFAYGLTDSVVIFHNWQHWAYDYRLPDIYPPNRELGTLEELRELNETCRRAGVLFAPHDNYADFYPDAEGFTYDRVAFQASGEPRAAWFNAAMQAQS